MTPKNDRAISAPGGQVTGEGLGRLAAFAADRSLRMPERIIDKARSCLLYALAVGIGAMRARQPRQAARAFRGAAEPAPRSATRFVDGCRVYPDRAAFANAVLLHARVQDDAHPAGHVGTVVVPAALAVAEAAGESGAELLCAIAAGYEVALRIGRDHASDLSARGFRTTGAYGVFGAAAAAARLRRLDPTAMRHALALAANFAAGLREFAVAGSDDYPFQAGIAAANGVLAAELAASGATAAASALDGTAGFFRAFGRDGVDYAQRLGDALGERFEIEAVTYKPYPICQFHRGIVRGASVLRERAGARALRGLEVRLHPFEADFYGVRYGGPFTSFAQTFMSAPWCAAMAWTRGGATLASLNDFTAADIVETVPRIDVVADASRSRYSPRLIATLVDGAVVEWEEHDGETAYLLTWDAARHTARSIGGEMGVPSARVDRLIASAAEIDAADAVPRLVAAMDAACEPLRKEPSK